MRAVGAAVMVVLLGACSSGGNPAAGGGSGGAVGTGGHAGAGGAPGQDAGIDVPASDGGASMNAEQACRAAVVARCQRLATCGGDFRNIATCPTVTATCPEYFFNEASTRTVAGIAACLDQLAQQSCTEVQLGLFPSCWSRGLRPAGAGCAYPSNCASGGCSSNGTICGRCSPDPAATGESCAAVGCRTGDFCHPGTQRCTSAATLVLAAQGEPCDLSAEPAVGCTGDLHCIRPASDSSVTTAGTCQPLPILGLGQSCDQPGGGVCGPSLICFTNFMASGTTSSCVAEDPEPNCGAAPCDDATYCASGDGGRHCAPRAAVGASCLNDAGAVAPQCVPGSVCFGSTGVCTRYGARGDVCAAETQPCESNLVCTNGHCAPLRTEACPLVPLDGGTG